MAGKGHGFDRLTNTQADTIQKETAQVVRYAIRRVHYIMLSGGVSPSHVRNEYTSIIRV